MNNKNIKSFNSGLGDMKTLEDILTYINNKPQFIIDVLDPKSYTNQEKIDQRLSEMIDRNEKCIKIITSELVEIKKRFS